jgi:hypothetical protein
VEAGGARSEEPRALFVGRRWCEEVGVDSFREVGFFSPHRVLIGGPVVDLYSTTGFRIDGPYIYIYC